MGPHGKPGAPSEQVIVDGMQVHAWHGLRYAVAEGRFAPPLRATGRITASRQHEVPIFPQLPSKLAAAMGHGYANPQSEDAFFLNIWAPSNAHGLPVVLFIHGGAWMTGGGAMDWYDGSRLAAQGLVVVNVNYRLGPLGHLGRPDAHALPIPAADLLLALQCVSDNVRHFGGDSGKITLMGQSAGGWYAHLLSVLPQTRGLINRVALLSMGTRTPWLPQQQIEVTRRARLNVGGDFEKAPINEILKAGMSALDREPPRLGHAPSAFLPVASAGLPQRLLDPDWAACACHAEAVYLRYTVDESATFFFNVPEQRNATQAQVDEALSQWPAADLPPKLQSNGAFCGVSSGLSPYRQLVAASSWRQFQRFPAEYAAKLKQEGKNIQFVHFEAESMLEGLHSGHCFDLPFQFGNLSAWGDAPMLARFGADRFEAISLSLIAEIAAFARA
ncbi:carboxylesterase family protein [Cupriavidus pinatubonensis]|uniref:carboxylesterase family protein n=1 Tax=Cupriavidus pinatubonensis TaxID=248026 RepID=UPI0036205D72